MEKADSSSVLPCPVSISTKNKMNFLFANLKDRDFLVQRISDFLQRTPDSSWGDTNPLSQISHSVCPSQLIPWFSCFHRVLMVFVLVLRRPPPYPHLLLRVLSPFRRHAIITLAYPQPSRVSCSSTTETTQRTWDPKP